MYNTHTASTAADANGSLPPMQRGEFSARPYLIIVRAGRNSLHLKYLGTPETRRYDMLITEYEPDVPFKDAPGVVHLYIPGNKLSGFHQVFCLRPEIFKKYHSIALIDDDIEASPETLNATFECGLLWGLDIWQPSLTWDSYFTYACFLNNPLFSIRFTNFIEMMCPFFSAAALQRAMPLFDLGYKTGVDLVWCRISEVPWFKAAILDTVMVRHTRPIGATKIQRGYTSGETYDDVFIPMLKEMGLSFKGNVVYAAIKSCGTFVGSRLVILLRSFAILGAVTKTPQPKLSFLRVATDHLRHISYRPINLWHFDLGQFLRRREGQSIK